MMVTYIALQEAPEPCNLYSDCSYVVNLLPYLPYVYIRLDANPISALMIQLGSLLNSRKKTTGAGEMAQWLRALPALPKVLSSIPSNYIVAHNHL